MPATAVCFRRGSRSIARRPFRQNVKPCDDRPQSARRRRFGYHRVMLRCTIVLVLALAGRAAAAPPMWVMEPRSSVALDALARGRLRLWLGTHVEICRIDTK